MNTTFSPAQLDTARKMWTEERVAKLRALHGTGLSMAQVAAELGGVTRNAVIGKIRRLKLPTNPYADRPSSAKVPRLRSIDKRRRSKGAAEITRRRKWLFPEPDPTPIVRQTPDIPKPEPLRLTLLQLTPHACRYIEDDSPPWTYCAHDALPGRSWCEFHYGVCINKVSASEANRRAARAANWR